MSVGQHPADRTVLFLLLPESGAFNASFVLARRLKERGHRITYVGPHSFKEHVSRQGFDYYVLEAHKISGCRRPAFRYFAWRRQYFSAFTEYHGDLGAIDAWLKANQPVLALIDPLMWRLSPPILRLRVPILSLSTTLASTFSISTPPVFSHLPPPTNAYWRSYVRSLLAWCACLLRTRWALLIDDLRLISVYGPIKYRRRRARSLVVRSGGQLDWGEYGPRLVAPELVMAPRDIDFSSTKSTPNRIYLGSCVDCQRRDDDFDWATIKRSDQLVYCSLGTHSHHYRHSKRLFSAVVEALRPSVSWQVVIQVGEAASLEDFGTLPKHIRLTKSAPQLELLQHADVFITHGGLSSVRESIYYGVPMIVFPCGFDQPGNAARVVYHHLGLRADISSVDDRQILALLKKIQEKSFRQSILRMQRIFQLQNSGADCTNWIEQFLSERS